MLTQSDQKRLYLFASLAEADVYTNAVDLYSKLSSNKCIRDQNDRHCQSQQMRDMNTA